LRTFLVALAIADDIGAVLVIALFYTEAISWPALVVAAGLLLALALAGRGGVNYPLFYVFGGVLVWLAMFESGMHATVAGVLAAMTVPARSWVNASAFLSRARALLVDFERSCGGARSVLGNARQQAAIEGLRVMGSRAETPMQILQSRLERWVAFLILPLFALANAAVDLSGVLEVLASPVTLGVALGLLVGKPVGITLCTYLAVRLGLTDLPSGVGWPHVAGVGLLGGIGFTMSLFITGLAFEGGELAEAAKVGIFAASLTAGLAGWALLRFAAPDGW
jgi:NhaA family Na+:H+ antiporter